MLQLIKKNLSTIILVIVVIFLVFKHTNIKTTLEKLKTENDSLSNIIVSERTYRDSLFNIALKQANEKDSLAQAKINNLLKRDSIAKIEDKKILAEYRRLQKTLNNEEITVLLDSLASTYN